jgi:hypothetical protein
MDSSSEAEPISAPMTVDSWLAAAHGDASGFWFMSLMANVAFPTAQVWGDVAAVSRADAGVAKRSFSPSSHDRSILRDAGADFIWAGGRLAHAWPSSPSDNQYSRVQTSRVATLLIGGKLDFATPPQDATRELLPHLPNGHQVVLPDFGHTTDFWTYQPKASTRLIDTFLGSGRVDASLYTRRTTDFEPGLRQTSLAKGIAGAMLGLPILAALSLLWMWRRVWNRGSFGRKASASLRSLSPLVLGLGGWLLGAIIVLTTMPTVPLDSEVLAGLAVGLPIGLGIYWSWVHREWSATTRAIGFAAAVGGALVGGWLGFNTTAGLLALLTTIAGAALGANLALLALDIAWDRSERDRLAQTTAPPVFASAGAGLEAR